MSEDEMTYSEAHELAVQRLLGNIGKEWSEREARYHAREFISRNAEDNNVVRLARMYLTLSDERQSNGHV